MAQMFYSLDEAAAKLGVPVEKVKKLAENGDLHQFHDRDKIMFKRDQVDALASASRASSGSASDASSPGIIPLADEDDDSGDTHGLEASDGEPSSGSDTDVIDLETDPKQQESKQSPQKTEEEADREGSGINIFETSELEPIDAGAQTQVTDSIHEEEMALESVGSGSGLLDLTRETDDTSLGAELLDEIYPGGSGTFDTKTDPAVTGTGVFDASATDFGTTPGGVEGMPEPDAGVVLPTGPALAAVEVFDPSGSGLTSGLLLGATTALVLALIVAVFALAGVPGAVTAAMASNLMMYGGGLLVLSLIFGAVGFFVGRSQQR